MAPPRRLYDLMVKSLCLATAGALFVVAPGAAQFPPSPPPADEPLSIDPLVLSGRLDNGLRYLVRANHKPENRAELRLTVDAGSILEDEGQQGLAHFVEHMAFNGTAHFARQALIDYMERIGMQFGPEVNAYTGFDETVYMLTVPTDSAEVMETAFQIFEDWAHQISFEDVEIDKERGVVTEERRLGRGAGQRMLDRQLPVLFRGSRYAERLPIGNPAVIDTFPHAVLRDFYATWYRPELMGFVAVGDFEPSRIETLVRQYMGRVPPSPEPRERVTWPVPDHEETLFTIATDPEATTNQVQLVCKRPVRDEGTVNAYRQGLIEGLYHRMLNQRLYELTKTSEPPFLGAGSGQGRWVRTKEVFVLGATVRDNGFEPGIEALLAEATRVQRHGFTEPELAREKREMMRGMEQAFRERDKEWSSAFAEEYVRHLLEAEPIPGIEAEYGLYQRLLPTISLAEVNARASEWTSDRGRVVMVNAPDKPGVGVPDSVTLQAAFARVATREIGSYAESVPDLPILPVTPMAGTIAATEEIAELGVTVWTLSNGVRVFLKPTDFRNDEVLLSAWSPGGHSLVPDPRFVAALTAAGVAVQGGVGPFTQIELEKKLAGKVVRVSPWIGALQEGFSGSASPEDLETLFQLVHAYFVAPRSDSTAFQALKAQYRGYVENRSARPETAFGDTLQVIMAQHHFRARPWSLAILDEMDLDGSMAVYRDRFADAGDFTFAFVGSFTPDQLQSLVLTYLASLPSLGRRESWRNVGIEPPRGVVRQVVHQGLEPKGRTTIVFSGPFPYDGWRNSFELAALGQVLEIKLREVIREDLGGTYGVGVAAAGERYPEPRYQLAISFGCDPLRVEELTQAVFARIDSLRAFGPAEEYVTKVVEISKRQREVQLKENGFWVEGLTAAAWDSLDPRLLVRYPEMVDSLTVTAVQAAATRYLDPTNYVQAILLPAEP